VEELACGDGVE